MIVSRRADAAAICEAVRRPTMRFVRIKSAEQQCQLMQHRTRDLMMRQRTQLINALRAHLAELGIVAAMGDKGFTELLAIVADEGDGRLPAEARATLALLAAQLNALQMLIGSLEKQIKMQHHANPASKRLETIPGIGIIGATAIAATVVDPTVFSIGTRFCGVDRCRGRNRAQASRSLDRSPSEATAIGAHSVLRWAMQNPGRYPWLTQLLARRPFKVVAVALANKMAGMAWALLT
jgi:transposase